MKSLRIHPATYIFVLILILTGFWAVVIPYLLSVVLHEFGHAIMAKKLGYRLNKIYLLPYGACLSFDEFAFEPTDEIKIALAGPLTNIILIVFCLCLWWLFPSSYVWTYSFVISNFSIAIFNLLPAFPLDGGRVLVGLMSIKNKRKTAFKIAVIFNIVFACVLFALFLVSFFVGINFSFGLLAIFLFFGIIEGRFQGKYSPLLYEFSSNKKEIKNVKSIFVSTDTPIYKILAEFNKHKFNVVYFHLKNGKLKMIDENFMEKIFISNSPQKSLKECLNLE